MHALNNHDKHTLTADSHSYMNLVCVFNLALEGNQVHGSDGSFS
ncbi:MAG: hypothetical protein ACI9ES_001747 [Oceanospirillaceae bacterium]|jgi:hypothetical protein